MTQTDDVVAFEFENDAVVEDIKVMICAEKGIDVDQQILLFNGRLLGNDGQRIRDAGIKNDDLILMSTKSAV